ncbi:MAG: bacterial proteasome activator family protein [Propionibacteriaceae bacterium]|jgi:hypothetical protein|nr:bacterial proteasome activator family protein [Propionibacteriaceae bacterium]
MTDRETRSEADTEATEETTAPEREAPVGTGFELVREDGDDTAGDFSGPAAEGNDDESAEGVDGSAGEEAPASDEAEAEDNEPDGIEPARIMRIGRMVSRLLEELREVDLDDPSRARLSQIYDQAIGELADGLDGDLADELHRITEPLSDREEPPTSAELTIAHAQLVGWLEGLFQGLQTAIVAQQMAQRALMPGQGGAPMGGIMVPDDSPAPGGAPNGRTSGSGMYL